MGKPSSNEIAEMHERNGILRLTDKNSSELIDRADTPFVVLFESRHDPGFARMLKVFRSILEQSKPRITGAVCMVEDAPVLSKRFNVYGVPTVVAGLQGSVLGKSLGSKTSDQLASLIETWLNPGIKQEEIPPKIKILYKRSGIRKAAK